MLLFLSFVYVAVVIVVVIEPIVVVLVLVVGGGPILTNTFGSLRFYLAENAQRVRRPYTLQYKYKRFIN